MQKISAADSAYLMKHASSCIREQQGMIHALQEKVAQLEKKANEQARAARISTIVEKMASKGLSHDMDANQLREYVEKRASEGPNALAVLESAVDLSGPDMGEKIGQLQGSTPSSFSGSHAAHRFVAGILQD